MTVYFRGNKMESEVYENECEDFKKVYSISLS